MMVQRALMMMMAMGALGAGGCIEFDEKLTDKERCSLGADFVCTPTVCASYGPGETVPASCGADADVTASPDADADVTAEATDSVGPDADAATAADASAETETSPDAQADGVADADATVEVVQDAQVDGHDDGEIQDTGTDVAMPEVSDTQDTGPDAADCSTLDDQCNVGVWNGAMCVAEPLSDGTPCEDGNSCTASDRCALGVCQPGPLVAWENTYPAVSYIESVAESPEGHILAIGLNKALSVTGDGDQVGPAIDLPGLVSAVTARPGGGFIVVGVKAAQPPTTTNAGAWVGFLDEDGHLQGQTSFFVGNADAWFYAVAATDASLFLGGCSGSSLFSFPNCDNELLVRAQPNGVEVWSRDDYVSDATTSTINALLSDTSGGVYVFGFASGETGGTPFAGGRSSFVNQDGAEVWGDILTPTALLSAARGAGGNILIGVEKPTVGDPDPMLLMSPSGAVIDDALPVGQYVTALPVSGFAAVSPFEAPAVRFLGSDGGLVDSSDAPTASSYTDVITSIGGGLILAGSKDGSGYLTKTDSSGAVACTPQ